MILGNRIALNQALQQLKIPFTLWAHHISNKNAWPSIESPFPTTKQELNTKTEGLPAFTHVIAAIESAVFPASKIRRWLALNSNPNSVFIHCTDKVNMKTYLWNKNIPMTPFLACDSASITPHDIEKLELPLILKPRASSGSRGIKKVHTLADLSLPLDNDYILEKYISGQEGSIESFISHGEIRFTNITQYFKIGHCNLVPAHYPLDTQSQIQQLNQKVIKALNIRWGMAHLEYYITAHGLLFGEIALRPPGGYIMEALSIAYQKNFWEIFCRVELDLSPEFPSKPATNYAASYIIHPPPGRFTGIDEQEVLRSLPSLTKLSLKSKIFKPIAPRRGLGEDYGHALFCSPDANSLVQDIRLFEKELNKNSIAANP